MQQPILPSGCVFVVDGGWIVQELVGGQNDNVARGIDDSVAVKAKY
jgi:hypothetical protein